ncbi:MAG: hypothetical protein ACP5OZ_05350, partial [Candidatus Woesearchaeota archaeon]
IAEIKHDYEREIEIIKKDFENKLEILYKETELKKQEFEKRYSEKEIELKNQKEALDVKHRELDEKIKEVNEYRISVSKEFEKKLKETEEFYKNLLENEIKALSTKFEDEKNILSRNIETNEEIINKLKEENERLSIEIKDLTLIKHELEEKLSKMFIEKEKEKKIIEMEYINKMNQTISSNIYEISQNFIQTSNQLQQQIKESLPKIILLLRDSCINSFSFITEIPQIIKTEFEKIGNQLKEKIKEEHMSFEKMLSEIDLTFRKEKERFAQENEKKFNIIKENYTHLLESKNEEINSLLERIKELEKKLTDSSLTSIELENETDEIKNLLKIKEADAEKYKNITQTLTLKINELVNRLSETEKEKSEAFVRLNIEISDIKKALEDEYEKRLKDFYPDVFKTFTDNAYKYLTVIEKDKLPSKDYSLFLHD